MLDTAVCDDFPDAVTFVFVVPGDRTWTIRTFCAVADTGTGGAPDRGFLISVTDGTNLVAQAGAADAGTEPATVTITWANSAQGSVGAANVGTSVAPFPNLLLKPGYVITGTITNPAAGDAWTSAVAWYDYVLTG